MSVLHVHASRENVGDDALVLVIQRAIAEAMGTDAHITAVSLDHRPRPDDPPSRFLPLYQLHRARHWPAALGALRQVRAVVVGGGELLGYMEYLLFPVLARLLGIPCHFVGVGSRLRGVSRLPRSYSRWALGLADAIVTRDRESVQELRALGVTGPRIDEGTDLVFALRAPGPAASRAGIGVVLRNTENPDRALTVRRLAHLAEGVAAWARARDATVHLLPFVPSAGEMALETAQADVADASALPRSDVAILRRFAALLPPDVRIVEHPPCEHPDRVQERLASLDLLVSMRLHGLILASLVDTPYVGLSYAPKLDRVLRQVGGDRSVLPMESLDEPHALPGRFADAVAGARARPRNALVASRAAEAHRILASLRQSVRESAPPSLPRYLLALPALLVALVLHGLVMSYRASRSAPARAVASLARRVGATPGPRPVPSGRLATPLPGPSLLEP